jgi:D-cysteine desulfhydrase
MKRDDLTGLEVSRQQSPQTRIPAGRRNDKGCDTIVTNGGFQSNHCRATAAIGARLAMRVRLILRSPETQSARRWETVSRSALRGADLSLHPFAEYSTRLKIRSIAAMDEETRAGGRRTSFRRRIGAARVLGVHPMLRGMVEQLGRDTKVDLFSCVSLRRHADRPDDRPGAAGM